MQEFHLGYREVIPDQTLPEKWKEITLNTGGSQSTLQDIKVPERAGGYAYNNSLKHYTRNRFIYWRISHDVLELVEQSLDVNLTNCRIRYKFVDTPILDGISIHETVDSVIILVVTVYSIYKLTFPHPDKIHRQEYLLAPNPDQSVQSIFGEVSAQNAKEPHIFHVIPNAANTNAPVPHAAASWLVLPQEEALFALAYSSGTILLLRLDAMTNIVHSTELKQDSYVPRFLSGIATAFRSRNVEAQVPMALAIHACSGDTYLFALCREGNVRMWSCNKAQCIAVSDVAVDGRLASQGAQGHILRKTVGAHDNELYLATYMKFGPDCDFSILKPVQEQNNIKFEKLSSLSVKDQHLVDFSLTSDRLWAVWRTTDLDNIAVTHAQLTLDQTQFETHWESVVLEQPPDKDYIASDPGVDPRQAYINYIFHPGQFSLTDVTRALSIYRRLNVVADLNLSPAVLKEKVCAAVEAEIQTEVMDYELMDEDYLEISNRCWAKFYSCVVQYHANGSKPLGLLLLPAVGGVALLKKSTFSLLRPMQVLEHLMLANERCEGWRFENEKILCEDREICQDLVRLVGVLAMVEEQLPEETKAAIEKEFYRLNNSDGVVEEMMARVFVETDDPIWDADFQSILHEKLETISNISSTIAMLLRLLVEGLTPQSNDDMDTERNVTSNLNHLFSSPLGISAVAESVAQISILRFTICRNLLILQQFLFSSNFFDTSDLESESSEQINSVWLPRTVVLTHAYYSIMWICESNASCAPTQALLENSSQRLSLLKLSETRANFSQRYQRSLSLIELFIQSSGSKHVHNLMLRPNFNSSHIELWHNGMLHNVMLIIQLLWPISNTFIFSEWLLSSCQFLLLQEYARLLESNWCEWKSSSRKFILAVALLEMGEAQKATDHFMNAAKGIFSDSFLANVCLRDDVEMSGSALTYYYLKVIELLEQHNAADCIIKVAETAISEVGADDPNLSTLYSIVFAQHLNLGHHDEAFNHLHLNPDSERRIDCLRQLIVTLFEKKRFVDLVSFPHTDMFEDLVRIVEARARSVDILDNHYYDFLYSFYVDKENWRKAASAKYEQAMRYSQENHSVPLILKQSQCLIACINVLSLVNEKYRWIVRPSMAESFADDRDPKIKRSFDGEEILRYKMKKQVEVLEIEDIRKEYAIVQAKLHLSKRNCEFHTVAQAGPVELVCMMSNVNLYTDALKLCDKLKLNQKNVVLEHLASQCLKLSHQDDSRAWDWLALNNVSELNSALSNVANVAWSLLEKLTLSHEEELSTDLHKTVAKKLIDHGAFFPQWLLSSYKKRNAAELLRLLVTVGRLAEATDLAEEYILALLGRGMENFNLKAPLHNAGPPVWFPINTVERLLLELDYASRDESVYEEYYARLNTITEDYVRAVDQVSKSMIEMKMKSQ